MSAFQPGKHSASQWLSQNSGSLELECDVAILGAGAGGCAAAARLAEAGLRVLLFESGRHWNNRDFKPSNSWAFRHLYAERGNRVAIGNGWMPINGGRGVGGSTLINSAISFPIRPEMLARWRDELEFDPKRSFEANTQRVMRTLAVGENPLQVQGRNNTIFAEGIAKLGWEGGSYMPRSAPGCVGCGICQLGCPSGGKWSADRSFLAEALQSDLVGVWSDCRATGALAAGEVRVDGLHGEILDPHSQEPIGSWSVKSRAVLVAGGSIGSPRFLMQSGLSESPALGQNLRLHPATGIFARMPEVIKHWKGVSQGYWVDRYDQGFLMETATLTPDANYIAMPLEPGPELNAVMADMKYLALAGVLVHDIDTVASVSPGGVSVQFGDQDRLTLLRGLQTVAEVFFAAGAEYLALPVAGAGLVRTMDEVRGALHDALPYHRILATSSHPQGTCRIGTSEDTSVTTPEGRVWGWDNLYVSDASTFPEALGVNPQVTVMAMALHVADGVAQALA